MKPPRGKRVDPQSRLAEFSSAGWRGRWVTDVIAPSCRSTLVDRRVHFPRAERHDRFSGGQKAARKVGGRFGALCYSLACPDPLGDRGAAVVMATLLSWGVRLAETGQPCLLTALLDGRSGPGDTGSVANRSALHPTRLETRTKESNMRASRWVVRNPKAK